MQITLYRRSFPVADGPVSVTFSPHSAGQRHTFTAAGRVYEADRGELQIVVPDGAKLDTMRDFLVWIDGKIKVKSTAREVFDLAEAGENGFRVAV